MRHANVLSLLVAILIMGLAVWAVPYPGRLVLLAPVILGAVIAIWRIRQSRLDIAPIRRSCDC